MEVDYEFHEVVNHLVLKTIKKGISPPLETDLRAIKKLCKHSPVTALHYTYHSLIESLQSNHCQKRFIALQITDELFVRSALMRSLVCRDLHVVVRCCSTGILPKPKEYQKRLKELFADKLTKWARLFGKRHPRLNDAQRWVCSGREQAIHERIGRVRRQMDDTLESVEDNLRRMQALFEILVPPFDAGDEDSEDGDFIADEKQTTFKDMVCQYGLGTINYKLDVIIDPRNLALVERSPENRILFDQLAECYRTLVRRHNSRVLGWIKAFKADADRHKDTIVMLEHLILEMKDKRLKAEELRVHESESSVKPPRKKIVNVVSNADISSSRAIFANDLSLADPLVRRPVLRSPDKVPGSPGASELPAVPVINDSQALYYWDKKGMSFNTSGLEIQHRFYGVCDDFKVPDEQIDRLTMVKRYCEPKKVEITPCLAPLKSGKLCQRRDKTTCPHHGKKVPRNPDGTPIEDETGKLSKEQESSFSMLSSSSEEDEGDADDFKEVSGNDQLRLRRRRKKDRDHHRGNISTEKVLSMVIAKDKESQKLHRSQALRLAGKEAEKELEALQSRKRSRLMPLTKKDTPLDRLEKKLRERHRVKATREDSKRQELLEARVRAAFRW